MNELTLDYSKPHIFFPNNRGINPYHQRITFNTMNINASSKAKSIKSYSGGNLRIPFSGKTDSLLSKKLEGKYTPNSVTRYMNTSMYHLHPHLFSINNFTSVQ